MPIPAGDVSHLGDPAGMESLAAELLLRAESIASVAQGLSAEADRIVFEGPAAEELRSQTERRRARAERVATELQEAAHTLKRRAADARQQIYEIQLAVRKAQEEGS